MRCPSSSRIAPERRARFRANRDLEELLIRPPEAGVDRSRDRAEPRFDLQSREPCFESNDVGRGDRKGGERACEVEAAVDEGVEALPLDESPRLRPGSDYDGRPH